MTAGSTASLFCVRIADNVSVTIVVRPGADTVRFKEAFPDAISFSSAWIAEDPVAEVNRQRDLLRKRDPAATIAKATA